MTKNIIINGVHIDSSIAMEKEILTKLKISITNDGIPFSRKIEDYMAKNKITELYVKWTFFSISLLKWVANSYGQKKENFTLGSESNMHFQAFNDILISEKESNENEKKEAEIKRNILNSIEKIQNFYIIYEM
ncbi:hypothetical protein LIS90_12850 [Flavobacterium psychrophilum]|uniref:hypothetical protein n=1 Tax=Flavobacterium psychrophilum TaxID=96345 RepID=UPI000B7C3EBF|nr:hypothetical protein [Flavobacterium psychrophilum]MCB6232133.1 hypothetical protein [Flavobacterium psychrophilum]SNA80394.1 hypothetical protein FI146_350007 [Flavobacterium psychrophilum]